MNQHYRCNRKFAAVIVHAFAAIYQLKFMAHYLEGWKGQMLNSPNMNSASENISLYFFAFLALQMAMEHFLFAKLLLAILFLDMFKST